MALPLPLWWLDFRLTIYCPQTLSWFSVPGSVSSLGSFWTELALIMNHPPTPLLETSWLNTILAQLSCCPRGLSAAPIWLGVLRLWKLVVLINVHLAGLGTETHSPCSRKKEIVGRNLGKVSQRSEDYTYNTTKKEMGQRSHWNPRKPRFSSLLAFPWIIPQAFSVFPSHSWHLPDGKLEQDSQGHWSHRTHLLVSKHIHKR